MRLLSRFAALALFTTMIGACSAGNGAQKAAPTRSNPNFLAREAIEASGDRANAYELVRALRPNWLIKRGVQTITQGPGEIVVYYGNNRLGGPESMRDVTLDAIEAIQFISAATATQRYGTNHEHGVILITPRGSTVRQDRG